MNEDPAVSASSRLRNAVSTLDRLNRKSLGLAPKELVQMHKQLLDMQDIPAHKFPIDKLKDISERITIAYKIDKKSWNELKSLRLIITHFPNLVEKGVDEVLLEEVEKRIESQMNLYRAVNNALGVPIVLARNRVKLLQDLNKELKDKKFMV